MRYRLKLNKTKMYQLMQEQGVELPSMRHCEFSHHGRTYWMDYIDRRDHYVHVCVCIVLGDTIIGFEDRTDKVMILSSMIPGQHLLDLGMLEEVGA